MIIDEAMAKIRQTERCWLVWNSSTGEILDVVEVDRFADRKTAFSHLTSLGRYKAPVATRILDSSKTTREILEKQQSKAERVNTRARTLKEWYTAPVDRLIAILEVGEYAYPMKRDHDSRIIVDHLRELHRDELSQTARHRLRALVGKSVLSTRAARDLDAYLLALEDNREKLVRLWNSRHSENYTLSDLFVLMDCFVHVKIADPGVINDLIAMVENPGFMFEPTRIAMMTLGGLDAARGTRAAQVIQNVVYDSTPEVIALRNRVLERLETEGTEWKHCSDCSYGHIHNSRGYGKVLCPHCLGLSVVHTGNGEAPLPANSLLNS